MAARYARELVLARANPNTAQDGVSETCIRVLETTVTVIQMAAHGMASSMIKYCPQLDKVLKVNRILPDMEEENGQFKDAIRNTRWVIPVEVICYSFLSSS